MRTRVISVSRLSLLLGAALVAPIAAGCATTDAAVPVTIAPNGQVDIDQSHWKVPVNEAGIDGRTIEIKRAANGHYVAKLVDAGHQLATTVGAYPGAVMMDFVPQGTNMYIGSYTPIGGEAREATFSIAANGQELKSSVEDYRWVRQP
jgi:opacity protein-like surface antigen